MFLSILFCPNFQWKRCNDGYISNAKTFFNKAISDILQKSSKLNKLYLQSITFQTLCEKYYNKDYVKLFLHNVIKLNL